MTTHDDADFVNVNFGANLLESDDDDARNYCHYCLDVVMSEWITDEIKISRELTKTVFDPSFLLIRFDVRSLYQK